MDQAAVYMSGHNGQYPGSSNGSYRPAPVGVAPPQGSKLATYMNRGGGGGQPGQNYDINNKMNNLSMMNRPPTPGSNYPGGQFSSRPPVTGFSHGPQSSGWRGGVRRLAPSSGVTAPVPGVPVTTQPPPNMTADKAGQAQALESLLREIEQRTGSSVPGRLSPSMRNIPGLGNGNLSAPPPLRTPNSVSSPSTADPAVTDAAAAAASAQVSVFSENGTTYFYHPEESVSSQLSTGVVSGGSVLLPQWSAYSGTPAHIVSMKVRNTAPSFVQDNDIKMELLTRSMICHTAADPEAFPDLPSEVDNFTGLCPLEPPPASPMHKSSTFGYVTTVYKAVNIKTGQHMCLRRIHGYRLVNTKCMGLVDQWKKMSHSNLVTLRQVFTSKSFGDHSMLFVYDFYPGSETLMSKHFNNQHSFAPLNDPFNGEGSRPYSQTKNNLLRQQANVQASTGLLPESVIWNYIIQLTSALRYIHAAGLACRTLDPTKILVLGKHRLLVNCGGIFDVLTFDPNSSNPMAAMAVYQQEDLVSLGKIVLALSCNSFIAIQRENLQQSMELVTTHYSNDLRNLIMYLLTNSQRAKSVNDLMPMVGARFYTALDNCMQRSDQLETELQRDIESARMFRLLTKLGTVVDRPELNMDTAWAETGDRYMLKLFRDYVFHQVMEDGRPFLDLAHVIACLNRLDAGIPDKVCLMSRDEQNVLVVSYAELKNCLEQSYSEVLSAATSKPKHHHHLGLS